jgi:hypothetical protein
VNQSMSSRLGELTATAMQASRHPNGYAYLPEIIESLPRMAHGQGMDGGQRRRLAGSLGRLITEDQAFAQSPLGTTLLQVADDFAAEPG